MKIVHVYANNLSVFEKALEGTGCKVNGSRKVEYVKRSLTNFNARDVLGLIVFKRVMTRKTLDLIQTFDNLFVFNPQPIVVICDQANELYNQGKLKVKYSPLFLVDSVEGTISDIDIKQIFTSLACISGDTYDLKGIDAMHKNASIQKTQEDMAPVLKLSMEDSRI